MSKSQAPAPEGQPTHGTKIRVHGVDDNGAQQVLNNLQGAIRSFLGKNQQQVALSGLAQYASTMQVPGGSLHYKNNNGIETLDVHVENAEQASGEEEGNAEYWQWAIVELTIPDMTKTSAEMSAFMNPPPNNPDLSGIARDNDAPYDPPPAPLCYPSTSMGAVQLQVLSGQSDQVSSLRVDLRPYPGGVKFDLYGYIHSYVDPDAPGPANSSFVRAERKSNSVSSSGTYSTFSGLHGSYPNSSDIGGRTLGNLRSPAVQSVINAQFPETIGMPFSSTTQGTINSDNQPQGGYTDTSLTTHVSNGPPYCGVSISWSPGSGNMPDPSTLDISGSIGAAGGLFTETTTYWSPSTGGPFIKKQRGLGYMDYYANASTSFLSVAQNGIGPVDANGNWSFSCFDYTFYWLASFDPAPATYPTRIGPLRFSVFDGEEPKAFTTLQGVSGGFGTRRRWEDVKRGVANRWPFKQIAAVNIVSIDDPVDTSIDNHFGMVKLGTVIINPRKGKGGIKFIAA